MFNLANVSRVVEAIAAYTIDRSGADRSVVVVDAHSSDFFAAKVSYCSCRRSNIYFDRDLPTPVVATL